MKSPGVEDGDPDGVGDGEPDGVGDGDPVWERASLVGVLEAPVVVVGLGHGGLVKRWAPR